MQTLQTKIPKIVPWRTSNDLLELATLFYSSDLSDKKRAVSLFKAYQTRGNVAQSVDSTSLLVAAYINDCECSEKLSVRASYAFAIIRFVNGLLDPYQQNQFVISLHTLARNIGLPSAFVELRHVSTHETLPSLETLRLLNKNALQWLWDNYWLPNKLYYTDHPARDYVSDRSGSDTNATVDAVKEHFRVWRRLRRTVSSDASDPNILSSDASDLSRTICACPWPVIVECMLYRNILLPNSAQNSRNVSAEKVIGLYWPLLDWFPTELVQELGQAMARSCGTDNVYVSAWLKHLLAHLPVENSDAVAYAVAETVSEENYDIIMSYDRKSGALCAITDSMAVQLDTLGSKLKKPSKRKSLSHMGNEVHKVRQRAQELAASLAQQSSSVSNPNQPLPEVWPTVPNWTPRPFGVL